MSFSPENLLGAQRAVLESSQRIGLKGLDAAKRMPQRRA
jgi:hypothetical protein